MECMCLSCEAGPWYRVASLKWTCGETLFWSSMHFFQHVLSSVKFLIKYLAVPENWCEVSIRNHLSQYHTFSSIFALYTLLIYLQKMMNHKGNVKENDNFFSDKASGYWLLFLFIWLISLLLNMRRVALNSDCFRDVFFRNCDWSNFDQVKNVSAFLFYISITEWRNVFCMFCEHAFV